MMNHVNPHPHHAMRNEPNPYMQPPHYPNAHPMPTPQQRSMMGGPMEPGYQMNNQQPPHVQMMHPSESNFSSKFPFFPNLFDKQKNIYTN